ncbi:replication-associated recombination protein A [Azospirillum doebereinerae]|uniref:replication-associated recombination protein A n=1 Tax=Azospirillum doebereinerae TaxID=92933 RepID=UPI001EE5AFEE|nr:replication-associated recombination protein A [Azospirillum doebereinerae]MCG5239789.1 replication-associated recombination protein A [Azospirillum doebereinerae]
MMSTPSLLAAQAPRPLADRLRPTRLSEVAGQDHLLGPDGPIGRMAEARALTSMILWGPPGCGKTTIARLLAQATDLRFESISALQTGVADLRKVFEAARQRRDGGQGTLLFCDEIHHFNRTVQDSFLPYLEDGTVTLVGATTENPSFELNAAILSRVQVFVLRRLDEAALDALLARAEEHVGRPLPLQPEARSALLAMADGDGRFVLNMAEQIYALGGEEPLDNAALGRVLQRRLPSYDKSGDGHYNLLSAFHKSLRASDANAALYWMCRMLAAGEDWRTIARRMLCVANEDVGLADPNAILQATAAWETYERLGAAEGERALAQACLYLATAPKSNAVEVALGEARKLARMTGSVMPPMHAVNAPTKMMAELGYKQGYIYDHDTPEGFSGLDYFPESVGRHEFYRPVERGFERDIRKRLDYWAGLRRRRK